MNYLRFTYCFALLILSTVLTAQTAKDIANQHSIWYGYYLTLEISPKWRLVSEVQERHFVDPVAQHQWLVRTRLYRSLGQNWDAALGFVHFWNNPNDPCTGDCLTIPEVRPYQEFQYRQTLGKGWSLRHRYVIEERFFRKTANGALAPGYNFNWRFRYKFDADFDLFKIKKIGQPVRLRLAEELMLNAGKRIVANMFDQNRLYAGIQVPFSKNMSAEVGYLHWFQERSSGNQFYNRHILRFSINQKIKL